MPAKAWGKMRIASKFAGAGAKAPAPGGAEQVATLVTALNSQWEAKKAVQMVTALEALAKLDPAELTKHAGAVHQVAQTPGTYRGQMMAHVALHKIEPTAGHIETVLAKLQDPDKYVRHDAVQTLAKLQLTVLTKHASAIVSKLTDSDDWVRRTAVETLGLLEPEVLAEPASAIVGRLEDSWWGVRKAAVGALERLEHAALAKHTAALVAALKDSDLGVRLGALEVLGKIRWETVAEHKDAIKKVAEKDPIPNVKDAAAKFLAENAPQVSE